MLDATVIVAGIAGAVALAGAIVAWLAQRDVAKLRSELSDREERLRINLARDLAGHESALRVQGELRLRLHDRSWGILQDLVEAVGHCQEAFNALNGAVIANASLPTTQAAHDAAAAALAHVESLISIAPPSADLQPLCTALKEVYVQMGEARFDENRRSLLGGKAHFKLYDTVEANAKTFATWNAELWRTVLESEPIRSEASK